MAGYLVVEVLGDLYLAEQFVVHRLRCILVELGETLVDKMLHKWMLDGGFCDLENRNMNDDLCCSEIINFMANN